MRRWIPPLSVVVALAFSLWAFPRLPDRVPTHWGIDGQVNGWSGRAFGAFFLPVLMAAMWGLFALLPRIDPRARNYDKFRATYDAVVAALILMALVGHVAVVGAGLGWPVSIARVYPVMIGALLVFFGNLLPRARSNFFFGIRTPWTLSSERVWERTHRFSGAATVLAGIVVILSVFAPPRWSAWVILSSVMTMGLASVVYSYVAWRQETGRGHDAPGA